MPIFVQKYTIPKIECLKIIQFSPSENDLRDFNTKYFGSYFKFVEPKGGKVPQETHPDPPCEGGSSAPEGANVL